MGFFSSLFGIGGGKPGQTVMTQKLPEEIAPHAERMLAEAESLYKQRMKDGYQDYKGQTIAGFTDEQKRAMEGIESLVGTSAPLMDESINLTRGLQDKFTAETAQEYMSPYQQAVTDIEKREAQKVFERDIMPRFEKQAVEAGGMSGMGSRAGIQAAQLGQAQMQQLGDIQTKGSDRAYQAAVRQFQNQKERERMAASGLMEAGPKKFKAGMLEQGALQSIGEQKQDLSQTALDEAYLKFIQKQQFPAEQLAQYSGFVTMNPYAGLKSQTETQTPYKPSFGQQMLGIGTQLGSAYLGGPGGKQFGKYLGFAGGGAVGGGLASLVYRDNGGRIDEAYPSNPLSLREEDPELAAQANLERRIAQANQYGHRNPEQQRARQQAEAQAKLDFLRSSGGGDKPFAQTAIADLLRGFSKGIIREDQNIAEEVGKTFEERRKGQKERQKLLDAQGMANITAEFLTEDEIFKLPTSILAEIKKVAASELSRKEKLANIDLIKAKALKERRGEIEKFESNVRKEDQQAAVLSDVDEVIKSTKNEVLKKLYEDFSDEKKEYIGRLIMEEQQKTGDYRKAILTVLSKIKNEN